MVRWLTLVIAATALGSCYNPRYPSEIPGAEAVPHETGNSQETSVRARDRRDGAAASGSSSTGY